LKWIGKVAGFPAKVGKWWEMGVSFRDAFRDAGWFGNFSEAFKEAKTAEDVLGDMAGLGKGDGYLVARLGRAFPSSAEWLANGAGFLKGVGTAAGVLGAAYSAFSAGQAFARGDIEGGIVNSVGAVGGALMLAPPPADIVGGVLLAGSMIYEHREAIGHAVEAIGRAELAVADGMGKAVSSIGSSVGKSLSRLNPFD